MGRVLAGSSAAEGRQERLPVVTRFGREPGGGGPDVKAGGQGCDGGPRVAMGMHSSPGGCPRVKPRRQSGGPQMVVVVGLGFQSQARKQERPRWWG